MEKSDGQSSLQELLAEYIVFHQAQRVLLLGSSTSALAQKVNEACLSTADDSTADDSTADGSTADDSAGDGSNAGAANSDDSFVVESLCANEVADDLSLLQQMRWSVVALIDSQVPVKSVISVLSRVRDLHADRVLHICSNADWTIADSLALGFTQLVPDTPSSRLTDDLAINLFEFDIHHYKGVPDWLNARHWANPELWGKHRW